MILQTEAQKISHLLRRFGLGASAAEMEFYGKNGLKGAIELLIDSERSDGITFTSEDIAPPQGANNPRIAQAWWMARFLVTENPLREKLTLFWHDHFAVSSQKVSSAAPMIEYVNILRDFAMGPFEHMLIAVSKNPAMLYWLDNQLNTKGKPNENFAREIMELFTLGVGHYTEKDIQEAARAFTGWGYGVGRRQVTALPQRARMAFIFDPAKHDDGPKSVFGKMGTWNGEDICKILCDDPQCARYITTKMWEWFAYPEPEKALIDRLTAVYIKSHLRTSELVRAIMESPEFYTDKAARAIYKNPIDFVVATGRQMGLGGRVKELASQADKTDAQRRQTLALPTLHVQAIKAMGMEIMTPPDVAGWEGGESWISSATMVERIKWADRLFGNRFLATQLMLGMASTTDELVASLLKIFDVELPATKVEQLQTAAKTTAGGTSLNARNVPNTCIAVTRMIFASPEFQFC